VIYILIFFLQFFFNISKVLEIKYTYENKLNLLILNTVVINLLTLAATYFSIDYLLKGEFLVILFYIMGGVFGKWFALTHFENYRAKILNLFKNGTT
jgi:hypothetical protein